MDFVKLMEEIDYCGGEYEYANGEYDYDEGDGDGDGDVDEGAFLIDLNNPSHKLFNLYSSIMEEVLMRGDEIELSYNILFFSINHNNKNFRLNIKLDDRTRIDNKKDFSDFEEFVIIERIERDLDLIFDVRDEEHIYKKFSRYFNQSESSVRDDKEKVLKVVSSSVGLEQFKKRVSPIMNSKNRLYKLYMIIRNAFDQYKTHCFCCGNKLMFDNGPWLCDNKWCHHRVNVSMTSLFDRYQKYDPDNLKFVFDMMKNAMRHSCANNIMKPYPDFVSSWDEFSKLITDLPSYNELLLKDNTKIKNLLWWGVMNMNSRIELLKSKPNIELCFMNKIRVIYGIKPYDCYREEIFLKKKEQYGSEYFFHGSMTDSWYSILKYGLIVMSNKPKLKRVGAAYGAGIYMTKNMNLAKTYSNGYIGIIEVIKGMVVNKSSNIYTLSDDKMVRVRYLIKYT